MKKYRKDSEVAERCELVESNRFCEREREKDLMKMQIRNKGAEKVARRVLVQDREPE